MDKKTLKQEIIKILKKEISATGTGASVTPGVGAGVATKYAFGKRNNKGTPKDWKPAPSIPNRKSKTMDYKELWESQIHKFTQEEFNILKQAYKENGLGGLKIGLTANGDIHVYVSSDSIFDKAWEVAKDAGLKAWEISFASKFGGAGLNYIDIAENVNSMMSEENDEKKIARLQKIADDTSKMPKERDEAREKMYALKKGLDVNNTNTDEILTYLQAAKQNGTLSPDAQEVFIQWMNTPGASREEIVKVLRNLTGMYLKEGYAQFKNSTKTRTKPEQYHSAVKEVKKKVNEINRLFEYMDRLKSELNEGEEIKYKKYTEKAIQQIKESTKSLFFKSTKLK
jgi:hypothetical protein